MLYGSPQFIQDAGCVALSESLPELEMMRLAYMRRAEILLDGLADAPGISCHRPEAGMFVLVDVRQTGLDGWDFAEGLFEAEGVSTLPGEGFGANSAGHVRISLAVDDERLREACRRITRYARELTHSGAVPATGRDA
jgi:arginine:pyruvate transaminase